MSWEREDCRRKRGEEKKGEGKRREFAALSGTPGVVKEKDLPLSAASVKKEEKKGRRGSIIVGKARKEGGGGSKRRERPCT